jgi:uncharacterized membrane protein
MNLEFESRSRGTSAFRVRLTNTPFVFAKGADMATQLNSNTGFDRPDSVVQSRYVEDAEPWNEEDWDEGPLIESHQLSRVLGWFSIALGVAEILAPRSVGRAIGVGDQPALLRLCGLREVTNGVGLLSQRMPSKWAMARVAGDVLDLALLGNAARRGDADRTRITLAAAAVAGVTALDFFASRQLRDIDSPDEPVETVVKAITINAAPDVIYRFWRDLENFPRFMQHIEEVRSTSERTSHWIAKAPAGTTIEWDAEIVEDEANARIAWRTLPDSAVEHEGIVSFEPAIGGRGTIVRVSMSYVPPAGKVGLQIAKLFGEEPNRQIDGDLRRMKQLIETGEIATTDGQPSGRRSILGRSTLGRWLS